MKFPDPNVGYVFGYKSKVTDEGILVTFLWEIMKISFKFKDLDHVQRVTYNGGIISWDVVRWGKCPHGTDALNVVAKKGFFRNNLIVFDDLDAAVSALKSKGIIIE